MRLFLIVLLNLIFVTPIFSQDITYGYPVFYRIAPSFNFKASTFSITFDDGANSQFSIGVPLLNERNIKGTFYIITSELINNNTARDNAINAFNNHHEIGSHTFHHVLPQLANRQTLEFEFEKSKYIIDSILGSNSCLTIAYPGGRYNNTTLEVAQQYYLAGRSGFGGFNDRNPVGKYNLKSMVYYQKQGIGLLNNWIYHAIRHHFWLIETFHGIDDGYEPIRTREFINHLNIIKSVEDQMWIATVSDVIKYVDEKNSAKISCDSCDNDRFYQFRVEDNLDDSIFNIPLSISMKIPDNWEGVNVSGAEYKNVILEEGDKFVLFNALPNSKEILIKPENIVTPPEKPDTRFVSIGPSPFKEYINVAFETKKTSNIKVILKNVLGIPVLIEFVVCDLINQVKFNTDQIPNGTYIIELINETNNQRLTRKVIKR